MRQLRLDNCWRIVKPHKCLMVAAGRHLTVLLNTQKVSSSALVIPRFDLGFHMKDNDN